MQFRKVITFVYDGENRRQLTLYALSMVLRLVCLSFFSVSDALDIIAPIKKIKNRPITCDSMLKEHEEAIQKYLKRVANSKNVLKYKGGARDKKMVRRLKRECAILRDIGELVLESWNVCLYFLLFLISDRTYILSVIPMRYILCFERPDHSCISPIGSFTLYVISGCAHSGR